MRRLFLVFNDGDVLFGGFKDVICLEAEIPQDRDLVIFDHRIWCVVVSFLVDFEFLLSDTGTSANGRLIHHVGSCILSAHVFHKRW